MRPALRQPTVLDCVQSGMAFGWKNRTGEETGSVEDHSIGSAIICDEIGRVIANDI